MAAWHRQSHRRSDQFFSKRDFMSGFSNSNFSPKYLHILRGILYPMPSLQTKTYHRLAGFANCPWHPNLRLERCNASEDANSDSARIDGPTQVCSTEIMPICMHLFLPNPSNVCQDEANKASYTALGCSKASPLSAAGKVNTT